MTPEGYLIRLREERRRRDFDEWQAKAFKCSDWADQDRAILVANASFKACAAVVPTTPSGLIKPLIAYLKTLSRGAQARFGGMYLRAVKKFARTRCRYAARRRALSSLAFLALHDRRCDREIDFEIRKRLIRHAPHVPQHTSGPLP
jgi:hypothetical protein